MRRILKVCKEHARVSAMNMRSQNSVRKLTVVRLSLSKLSYFGAARLYTNLKIVSQNHKNTLRTTGTMLYLFVCLYLMNMLSTFINFVNLTPNFHIVKVV